MSGVEKGITAFLAGLITITVLTVVLNSKNQTPAVLGAAGGAISSSLSAAQGNPVNAAG